MQVGTIQTDLDELEGREQSRGSRGTAASAGSRENDGGGGGGSGSGGSGGSSSEPDNIDRDKSRIIAWFLLLIVLMTFGGLIGAYIVIATNGAIEWTPFSLPIQVWMSTIIILGSSFTYEFFRHSVEGRDLNASRRYLIATTALGGIFIGSQLLAWVELVNRGFYMRGNPYAGFFYILTAAHAIHVLGGIIALGAVLRRSWYRAVDDREQLYRINLAKAVGWYWHLMGGLWVVLFLLLGFWK